MKRPFLNFVPRDRLKEHTSRHKLPERAYGSALFADISGFTPLTEALRREFGVRQGAEKLTIHLNHIYNQLIRIVHQYDGSVVGFSGDAITVWFTGENAAAKAAQSAIEMQQTMQNEPAIPVSDGEIFPLTIKIAITSGTARRFLVGDPKIQLLDVLAGKLLERLAKAESIAKPKQIVIDDETLTHVGIKASDRRIIAGERLNVFDTMTQSFQIAEQQVDSFSHIPQAQIASWVLEPLRHYYQENRSELLTELRNAVAMFVHFQGINYEDDPQAGEKLNRFVRKIQHTVKQYGGLLLQLTVGDKGSYLYVAFGAPIAHEDDVSRALQTALEISKLETGLFDISALKIGLSQGIMRTGTYGSDSRRTFGVLGDEVNLAARLMMLAGDGKILVSEKIREASQSKQFAFEDLPAVKVKGKQSAIKVAHLLGQTELSFAQRFYTTPLIGRDDELAALQKQAQPLFSGKHAGIHIIYGEPGIGKSRLAYEFQKQLEADHELSWFVGQAEQINRAPLGAFVYFLRGYFRQDRQQSMDTNLTRFEHVFEELLTDAETETAANLRRYRSYLAGLLGLSLPDSPFTKADEQSRIDNALIGIRAWAKAESRKRPLIIHIEDVQWLTPSATRALEQLVSYGMENSPIFLLLTSRYRDDQSKPLIFSMPGVQMQASDLGLLTESGVEALATELLNGKMTHLLKQFVSERGEGNPFFTEQLITDLSERGALFKTNGTWHIHAQAMATVPQSVTALLVSRLDRLAPPVKGVVQTASVLEREFDGRVLSHMLSPRDHAYIDVAQEESIWSAIDEVNYLFRHALLRDAAYQMQVRSRLQTLHRLAAESIEYFFADDPSYFAQLLEHWHQVGNLDKELAYLDPIVEQLVDVTGELDYAGELLNRFSDALPADDARRRVVWYWQARIASILFQLDEGEAKGKRALALAKKVGDQTMIAKCLRALGGTARSRRQYQQARNYLQKSHDISEKIDDSFERANTLLSRGLLERDFSNYKQAELFLQQSINLFQSINDSFGIINGYFTLSLTQWEQGNLEQMLALTRKSLLLAEEAGHIEFIGRAYNNLGLVAFEKGEYPSANQYWQKSLNVFRDLGYQKEVSDLLNNIALVNYNQQKLEESESYFQESLTLRKRLDDEEGVAQSLGNLSMVFLEQGRYEEALDFQTRSLEQKRPLGNQYRLVYGLNYLGFIYLKLEQHQALPAFHEALTIAQSINAQALMLTALVGIAEIHWQQENHQRAFELAGLVESHPAFSSNTGLRLNALLEALKNAQLLEKHQFAMASGQSLALESVVEQELAFLKTQVNYPLL